MLNEKTRDYVIIGIAIVVAFIAFSSQAKPLVENTETKGDETPDKPQV